jgi:1-acyl-sn-glycerol-3-phosphate acyltransferase
MATTIFLLSYVVKILIASYHLPQYMIPFLIVIMPILSLLTVLILYLIQLPYIKRLPPAHPYKAYLMRSISFLINRFFLRLLVTVSGLEHIPLDKKLIIYANHKSYTDAFSMMEYFPRNIALTPKKSVMKIPIIKSWLKAFGVFPINRKSARETFEDFPKAVELIDSKLALLLFPEGTIQYRLKEKIEYMKAGAFKLTFLSQADILVCRYQGNDLLRKRTPFMRNHRHIEYMMHIPFDKIKDMTTQDLSLYVMSILNDGL